MWVYILVYETLTVLKLILTYNLNAKWNRVLLLKWNVLALSKWNKKNDIIHFDTFMWNIYSKLKCSCRSTWLQQNCIFGVEHCSPETYLSSCSWSLLAGVRICKLIFQQNEGYQHVKSTIHFQNWPWIMQLHLKPESYCDKTGSNHSMKYFYMCSPLTRLPYRSSRNMPLHRIISVLGNFPSGVICASDVPERIQMENLVMAFPKNLLEHLTHKTKHEIPLFHDLLQM